MIYRLVIIEQSKENCNKRIEYHKVTSGWQWIQSRMVQDLFKKQLHWRAFKEIYVQTTKENNSYTNLTYLFRNNYKVGSILKGDITIAWKMNSTLRKH